MTNMFSPTSSLPSAPGKRRKIAVTWSTLCKDIPEDQKHVEDFLQNGDDSAEVFCLSSERTQRLYLNDILGVEVSEVIELLIKAAKQIKDGCLASSEMTTIEKVEAMILAPSTELEPNEVLNVLNFIFGWNEKDMASICRKLKALAQPLREAMPQEETIPQELIKFADLFRDQVELTLNMGTKEASGYAQLSDYLLCIGSRMHTLYPGVSLNIDAQFQIKGKGKSFYDDGSLVAMVMNNRLPVYVVEYKPRVPRDIEDVDPPHWSELFLQAYYLHKQYSHPILHVLTDLMDFQCFVMKQGHILQHYSMRSTLAEPQELLKHSKFICSILKPLCDELQI